MEWSVQSSIILINLLITLTYFPLSITYYYRIVKPNAKLPLYRVRRPKFFFLFMIMLVTNGVIRITLSLLSSINIIHHTIFTILLAISSYYGSLTLSFIRVWLLYYDIRSARSQRQTMLSQQLSNNTDDIMANETKRSFRNIKLSFRRTNSNKRRNNANRNIFGKYKPLLTITYSITTVVFIIDIMLYLNQSIRLRQTVQFTFVIGIISVYTFILISLWNCCNLCRVKKEQLKLSYRDDWNLLLELSMFWILLIFGSFVTIISGIIASDGTPIVISCITTLLQTSNFLLTFFCPYSILKQLKKSGNNQKKKNKNLGKILSKKCYFFAFVQHLVHELSIENLTFLMAVWQFKYEEKYDLTNDDKKDVKKAQMLKQNRYRWNRKSTMESFSKENGSVSADSLPNSPSISAFNSSFGNSFENINILKANKFMDVLPWSDLPLSELIAMNPKDKWTQCIEIFQKFIGYESYHSVNIGYVSVEEIYSRYKACCQYKKNKINSLNNNIKTENINAEITDNIIANDAQFDQVMMGMFDCAIRDIMQNLNDSKDRFVLSDTFKMLNR
eukprot:252220_1